METSSLAIRKNQQYDTRGGQVQHQLPLLSKSAMTTCSLHSLTVGRRPSGWLDEGRTHCWVSRLNTDWARTSSRPWKIKKTFRFDRAPSGPAHAGPPGSGPWRPESHCSKTALVLSGHRECVKMKGWINTDGGRGGKPAVPPRRSAFLLFGFYFGPDDFISLPLLWKSPAMTVPH